MDVEQRDIIRDLPFTVERSEEDSDGLTMTGYAAVFNQPARIRDFQGEFDEVIAPGAFADSLRERTPVLMFDHGHHPLLGSIPLGTFRNITEDDHGLRVEARFHNNWLTEPIRDAIRERSITGMSFRFPTSATEDTWDQRDGELPLRTITKTQVIEAGPVVFPAYAGTQVAVRSLVQRAVDNDADPIELAEALDAVLDAVSVALEAGDTEQASNLLDAAEVTVDALVALLGGVDPDDMGENSYKLSGSATRAAAEESIAEDDTRSAPGDDAITPNQLARYRAMLSYRRIT